MTVHKTLSTLDELDAAVVVLAQPRTCSGCGAPTWTASPNQPRHGRCLDCLKLTLTPALELALAERAEDLILDALPVDAIVPDTTTQPMAPGSYGGTEHVMVTMRWLTSGRWGRFIVETRPMDAGPCSLCWHTIRRYGPRGRALCAECEALS